MIHILNAPGSIHGPCDEGCIHPRCELEKMAAKQKCGECEKEVGFGKRYVFIDDLPVHVECLEPEDFDKLPDQEEKPPTTSTCG